MGIGVLGPLTIDGIGVGANRLGPRDRTVLAALVVAGDESLSLDQLAQAVWGEEPPASWRKVLHGCAARLRRTLGAAAIETVATGYRLAVAADDIDARRFDRLVRRGREQLALGAADRALFLIDEALGLWRGQPLVDVGDWEPGRTVAARLEAARLDAEELRLDAALRAGRHLEILAEAQARVDESPLRERRWAMLALAQYRAGRQSEALASLRRVRALLHVELGVDPGEELVALEGAILRHEPALSTADPPPQTSAACPYRGLIAYDVQDAETFFGRAAETAECLRRLAVSGVLAVVGASGCGKSSLVRAGVVAALRRQGRTVVVVTPGHDPMGSLATIPPHGPAPVLVVDQCEEVFTLCEDPAEQSRFLRALADHAGRGALVVVLRADHFGAASAHAGFARLVERGLYLLGPMCTDDLRTAIEAPAHQAGLLLEPGLVDLLVRDVEGEPGALPLLSHALGQTWRRREGRTLTVAGYRAAGGIRQAVANTAEELYDRTPAEQRTQLRDLFLRLVTSTPDGEPNRSRVPRRLVATNPAQDSMIERLVAARLVTSDDGVVELAHEAVARAWPRLRAWLDEDADGLRIRRHLTAAADAWDGMGRPDSEVYRGARLARAVEWHDRSGSELSPTEDAYLSAARNLAAAEETLAVQRARRQARANRRLRALLAAAVALMLLAAGAGVLAARQARRANTATNSADARRLAALAATMSPVDLALLLAVQGVRMDDTTATRAGLLAALNHAPQLIGLVQAPERARSEIEISPDGKTLTVLCASWIGIRDASTGKGAWQRIDAAGNHPRAVTAIRPDGGQIAVSYLAPATGPDRPVLQLISSDGRADATVSPSTEGTSVPTAISYSPDGQRIAVNLWNRYAQTDRGAVKVWDLTQPAREVATVPTHSRTDFMRFSADGSLLYIATMAAGLDGSNLPGHVAVVDAASGRPVRQFGVAGLPLDLSPDGRLLATAAGLDSDRGTAGRAVVLLDAVSGRQVARLGDGSAGQVRHVRFSSDGRLIAAATDDNTTTVWQVATGEPLEVLRGHAAGIVDIDFSPDAATLYTSDEAGTTLIWDLRGGRRFVSRQGVIDGGPPSDAQVSIAPNGRHAALNWVQTDSAGNPHGWLQIADLRTGHTTPAVDTGHGRYHRPAWRPDSNQLATTGADGIVRTWDPTSLRVLDERTVSYTDVPGVTYSRDGQRLILTDSRLFQLDADDNLRDVPEVIRLPDNGQHPTVGLDDRMVVVIPDATGSGQPVTALSAVEIFLVDLRKNTTRRVKTEVAAAATALSPDGRRLAVAGQRGEMLLLDARSGTRIRHAITGHTGPAGPVAFSADGGTIVSGGRDGRVTAWDGHTGELLGAITTAPPDVATYPAFLPDGHTVTIVASNGTIHSWDTYPHHWIAYACQVVGRDLTSAEWTQAVGTRDYQRTCTTP